MELFIEEFDPLPFLRTWTHKGERYKRVEMVGDGNCLFRAFAFHIKGDQAQWPLYRKEAALSLKDVAGADGESRVAVERGEWGGPLSVESLARRYRLRVWVVGWLKRGEVPLGYVVGKEEWWEVWLWFEEGHFDCLCKEVDP